MSPKDLLLSIKKYELLIEAKKKELLKMEELLTSIDIKDDYENSKPSIPDTSIIKSESVLGQTPPSPQYIADLKVQILQDIANYIQQRDAIINLIFTMPNLDYADILSKHWIEGIPLYEIADEKNYAYQTIRLMHTKALKSFEKMTKFVRQ